MLVSGEEFSNSSLEPDLSLPTPPVSESEPGEPDGQEMLSLSVVRCEGQTVVQAVGEIGLTTVQRFEKAVNHQLAQVSDVIVLNLSGLSFLASVDLSVLVAAQQQAESAGVQLRIATGNAAAVVRPLHVTGLTKVLTLEPVSDVTATDTQPPA